MVRMKTGFSTLAPPRCPHSLTIALALGWGGGSINIYLSEDKQSVSFSLTQLTLSRCGLDLGTDSGVVAAKPPDTKLFCLVLSFG